MSRVKVKLYQIISFQIGFDLFFTCVSFVLSLDPLCFRVLGLGPIQWKYAVSQSRDLV